MKNGLSLNTEKTLNEESRKIGEYTKIPWTGAGTLLRKGKNNINQL
jgi:hypothetical protein